MNKCQIFVRGYDSYWFKKLGKTEKVLNMGNISGKYDILTVKSKQGAHRGNIANITIGINQRKRYM